MEKLRRLLAAVGVEERAAFAEALEVNIDDSPSGSSFSSGVSTTTRAARAGAVANLRLQFSRRREVEQASLTATETADLLGITRQAVNDAIGHGTLLALKSGREWRIPVWQLDADRDAPVLPGLGDLARTFPGGPVALSRWAVRSNPHLGNRTPRELLVDGDVESVLRAASAATSIGW